MTADYTTKSAVEAIRRADRDGQSDPNPSVRWIATGQRFGWMVAVELRDAVEERIRALTFL